MARGLLLVALLTFVVASALGYVTVMSAIGLAINILYLWIFSDNVEDRLGSVRFVVLVSISAAAAIIASKLPLPSSAVAGVLGAYFVLYPRSKVLTLVPLRDVLVEIPAIFFLGVFVILHIPGGVALLIHVASGLAAGAVLCVLLRRPLVWS